MVVTIIGPERPSKAFDHLEVNVQKVSVHEGLLDDIVHDFAFFDASKGYYEPTTQRIYRYLWERVFESLTGERLLDCVIISILSEDRYLPRVLELFGNEERFLAGIGHKPMEVQGINVDGTWIIYREKKNFAMLADMYHEIGHRVYPKSANKYHQELGAYYFMFLALKKVHSELSHHGLLFAPITFEEQITSEHDRALREAKRLVDANIPYVHKVE